MIYRLTAKRNGSGDTTIWSTFTAESDNDAIDLAKTKLRQWEVTDAEHFMYARVKRQSKWVSVFWREIIYLDPGDWKK